MVQTNPRSFNSRCLGSLLKKCTIAGHVLLKKNASSTTTSTSRNSSFQSSKRRYAVLCDRVLYIFRNKLDETAQPLHSHPLYPSSQVCVQEAGLWTLQLISPISWSPSNEDGNHAERTTASLPRTSPLHVIRQLPIPSSLLGTSLFSTDSKITWSLQCPGKDEMLMWLNCIREAITQSRFLHAKLPPSPASTMISLSSSCGSSSSEMQAFKTFKSHADDEELRFEDYGRRPSCTSDISNYSSRSFSSCTSSETSSSSTSFTHSSLAKYDDQPIFELSIPEIPEENEEEADSKMNKPSFDSSVLLSGVRHEQSFTSLSSSVAVDIHLSNLIEATRLHTISCPRQKPQLPRIQPGMSRSGTIKSSSKENSGINETLVGIENAGKNTAEPVSIDLELESSASPSSTSSTHSISMASGSPFMGQNETWSVRDMLATLDSMEVYHLGAR